MSSWGWLAWFALVAASFGVFEYIGLRRSTDDKLPLTQAIQKLTTKAGWKRDLAAFGLFGFTFWFAFHLWL